MTLMSKTKYLVILVSALDPGSIPGTSTLRSKSEVCPSKFTAR